MSAKKLAPKGLNNVDERFSLQNQPGKAAHVIRGGGGGHILPLQPTQCVLGAKCSWCSLYSEGSPGVDT